MMDPQPVQPQNGNDPAQPENNNLQVQPVGDNPPAQTVTENRATQSGSTTPEEASGTDAETQFDWGANSAVNIPIIFAIIGFLYGFILFGGYNSNVGYHEIYLENKKPLVEKVIKNRIDALTKQKTELSKYSYIDPSIKNDTIVHRNSLFVKTQIALSFSQTELYNLENGNADTLLKYYLKYISIDRDILLKSINQIETENTKDAKGAQKTTECIIAVEMKDTCLALSDTAIIVKDFITLKLDGQGDTISFLKNNSTIGFWLIFSIAQITFWFLILPLVIGAVKRTDDKTLKYNLETGLLFSILPLVFILVFTILFYLLLIDGYIINDSYFLDHYNSKIYWYAIPGYIAAVICFGAYLYLSNKLELLDDDSTLQDNIKQEQYKKLTSTFNFVFLCTALILSAFVLWVGLTFTAVNSTEAMRFYTLLSGKPFLSYDFVYLLGLIHTLILLIFYIPVRIRFNKLDVTQQQQVIAAAQPASKKFWTGLTDILGTLLVTASPLIATFIQKLISLLSE